MKAIYQRPESLTSDTTTYCPGCGHGIIQKLIAEIVDELGIRERTIGVAPVGCAVLSYNYFNFDVTEAAHGRAPAVATAIKRLLPTRIVFTYQGDGDLAAIGTAEIIHAAARGENFSVFFVNNAVYGMTKGQMAPTTLLNQKTTTTTKGRNSTIHGYPIRVCELLSSLDGVTYLERTSISDISGILATRKAIKKAFLWQMQNKGMGFIEILSPCPVNWKKSPSESMKWIKDVMENYYPVKVFKDPGNVT
ncbi:MAG: thiamine pyrophosphate-dependent enzyme [Candidatus Omnitrophica bacterium]|nr:thiamine pyrophosphate-dependent enzyme [Candidatus Omnitrophota bacterium]MCM8817463.1 thiamine pyrophosphate-dependent enzyme [Candidatus Omnitrophota bacterium]